ITLVNTLLQPVLVTTFVLLGFGVPGVVLGLVLTPACALVLAVARTRRVEADLAEVPGDGTVPEDLKTRFAGYSAMTYLQQVTTWLYDLDVVVFLSAAALGLGETAILGFAYKFARDTLGYVWTPLTGVITPLLSRVKARDEAGGLQDAQASLSRMIWLLLVPSLAGLLLLAPGLLSILYPKYVEALPLVAVFLVFAFVESMLSVPQSVLMVCERYKPVVVARLLAACSIPLTAWLMPAYGLYGVAVAVGVARVASRLYAVAAGSRLLGLRLPWAFGARVGEAVVAMSAVVLALRLLLPTASATTGPSRLIALLPLLALALVGAAVFAVALRTLGGLEETDRRRLEQLRFPGRQVLLRFLAS
ncbi:MAG TPA: polysaccharide biosynthesis C-terminal domain-containing protein, partial [Vicinamibacteria bacterium]|nr:polysaccharide biosynthesis C-terminal domain-containing protein [Vicinamibacteria bacterium]